MRVNLSSKGVSTSQRLEAGIETIREWFHAVGRALQTVYTKMSTFGIHRLGQLMVRT
jgi:hypothetical protein